ncbi:MAG: DNA-binding response regulator, partial [Candidatus Omnitrophica bacterium]|nr:DNA-binding response regulator [Candidatus Omnitrophota bacterium]
YHRLNEFYIDLPFLRERKEDIPVLAKYFLDEANQEFNKKIKGFCGEAMKFFLNYSWPGNVRELKNLVKKAVLLSDLEEISLEHLSINHSISQQGNGLAHIAKATGARSMAALQNTIELQDNPSFKDITKEFEKGVIKDTLAKVGGSKIKAAKILHINRKALYRKMKSLSLL